MNYLDRKLKEMNISKTDLATRTGINRTTISKMCNRTDAKGMRTDNAYKIATVLGISVEKFINNMLEKENIIKEIKESDKINVGEYIRTQKGIFGKVIDISNIGATTRYLVKWDIGKAYYISQMKNIKHSKNIIDLIEVR